MPNNVLIVDDDYGTQLLLRTLLETQCYDWRLAESYEEAEFDMEWAEVAIVDLHLPTRSGLDVVATLREVNPTCRVVMLTGDDTAVDRAVASGVDRFLTKPFEHGALLEAIAEPSAYVDVRHADDVVVSLASS